MDDNIEDSDDYDIYADLDDNIDLDFNTVDNNCLNFVADNSLPLIVQKTNIETNIDSIKQKFTENTGTVAKCVAVSVVDCGHQLSEKSAAKTITEEVSVTLVANNTVGQQSEQLDTESNSFDLKTTTDESVGSKPDFNVTNDLILSEIQILETNLNKTEDNFKDLQKQNEKLKDQLEKKDKQLAILKRNISSLYKTAKAEIERKKQEIDVLRQDLDQMIFRRLPRNGIKVETIDKSIDSRSDVKTDGETTVCHKSSQTLDRDFRNNVFSKKSPDSSVRSPKQQPISGQKSNRKSRSKSPVRSRRSRSKSHQRVRRSSKSPQRSRRSRTKSPQNKSRKSRSKSVQRVRKSRSKSRQRVRRSRSRSNQRNRRKRTRTPDRHRNKDSKSVSKRKDEDKDKRKSDKSDNKVDVDPKRQKTDKK